MAIIDEDEPLNDYDPCDSLLAMPALLHRAGVQFCFETGSASMAKNLTNRAGALGASGLPPDAALRAVTLDAAEILGVGDRLGSLTPGKIADIIVTDGDPLEVTTSLHYLFIAGRPVPLESRHTRLYEQYRQRPSTKTHGA
jgi:imidazolonepropionase-like amidohydrolase